MKSLEDPCRNRFKLDNIKIVLALLRDPINPNNAIETPIPAIPKPILFGCPILGNNLAAIGDITITPKLYMETIKPIHNAGIPFSSNSKGSIGAILPYAVFDNRMQIIMMT